MQPPSVLVKLFQIPETSQLIAKATSPAFEDRKSLLFRDPRRTSIILNTIDDLRRYASSIDRGIDWPAREQSIVTLLMSSFPTWLAENCVGIYGHVHGDPNSRNILVCPKNSSDLRLIDCGGYNPQGLLVHDLAQMETDVKLSLLETEEGGGFMDLDANKLPEWVGIESGILRAGLSCDESLAKVLARGRVSLYPAYTLICQIRRVAYDLCRDIDAAGRHYFASLLYWNLKWLRLPTVRRTKKLLALYSASEILAKFETYS